MDLKRVNKIGQKYKNIIAGFCRRIQISLPQDSVYFNIADLIKHLILLYYYPILKSKILTDEEQEKFIIFLKSNNKDIMNCSWKLIFDSTKDGLKCDKFVNKVYDHPNILLLIELNGECIIGGYTKTGWNKEIYENLDGDTYEEKWTADKDAFVFNFKSVTKEDPFISSVKQDAESLSHTLGHCKQFVATFGWCWLFCIFQERFELRQHRENNNFEPFPNNDPYITRSGEYARVNDVVIEVFTKRGTEN